MTVRNLPKAIYLGPGCLVHVRCVDAAAMAAASAPKTIGLWDKTQCTVFIDSSLSLTRQWEVLRHELQHALIDMWEFTEEG